MKFGEKVRRLRNEKGLSQTELGKLCGLSLRTIRNYEVDGRYPKQREVYSKLAAALGCDVNYLLSENEEFVLQAKQTYGYQGARDAEELIADISALFAGGQSSNDAMRRFRQPSDWQPRIGLNIKQRGPPMPGRPIFIDIILAFAASFEFHRQTHRRQSAYPRSMSRCPGKGHADCLRWSLLRWNERCRRE